MTLKHLKIFATVCDYGSVTKAATILHLAQPSISLAIRELEEYYGIPLFDRIHRKLYVSERGKQFLDYARHILSLYENMENEMRNPLGILKVGSSVTIAHFLLSEVVEKFNLKYPEIKIHATIENSSDIEKRVLSNELDFALIEGRAHDDSLETQQFMSDHLVLICGHNHPLAKRTEVAIDELVNFDFLLREKGSGGRELFESMLLIHELRIKPIWESISTKSIIRAAAKGIGVSVLPYRLVENDLRDGNVKEVPVKDVFFKRPYCIIHHKNKYISEPMQYFIDLCYQENCLDENAGF